MQAVHDRIDAAALPRYPHSRSGTDSNCTLFVVKMGLELGRPGVCVSVETYGCSLVQLFFDLKTLFCGRALHVQNRN